MLNGPRFDFRANQEYRMDAKDWESVADDPEAMMKTVQWFMADHYKYQVPRILTLERYYNGDNDILFWQSNKAPERADNRIPSGLPHYATDINTGYELGKPLTYGYSNPANKDDAGQKILDLIDAVNSSNDMSYHDKMLAKNIHNTGRAYELMYVKPGTHDIAVRLIDPANAFVVYDTTMAKHSLFGVYYYLVDYLDKQNFYCVVYTDKGSYYYKINSDPSGEMEFQEFEEHYFFDVPLTEVNLNDERMGLWERKLSTIDAIDKGNSEMANSQEDYSNAMLVINGDIKVPGDDDMLDDGAADPDAPFDDLPLPPKEYIDTHSKILFLKPAEVDDGQGGVKTVPTSAEYLTKELDATGWKMYMDHLIGDFHKESYTPDMSDEQFSGNATGVSLSYKLLATDQERAIFETQFRRGVMRRLRLMSNYWSFISSLGEDEVGQANNVTITFNPNLPKVDSEIIANLTALSGMDAFSKQTIREKAADFTGVSAEQEKKRTDDEEDEAVKRGLDMFMTNEATDQQKAGVADDNADDPTADKPID